MTDTPLLSVRDLEKRYGARIGCTDVSFDLWPGEVMGICLLYTSDAADE